MMKKVITVSSQKKEQIIVRSCLSFCDDGSELFKSEDSLIQNKFAFCLNQESRQAVDL